MLLYRVLGIIYIRIDSLYIVQDSLDGFRKDPVSPGEIFAFFTLSSM